MQHVAGAVPALRALVDRRLAHIDLLPELKVRLLALLDADMDYLAVERPWGRVLAQVDSVLGGSSLAPPFMTAWLVMHAAAMHLDHLQDNDPIAPQLAEVPPTTQYQLVFASYVLATSLLDDLPIYGLPLERAVALHRLWSDAMLRLASGQYCDLMNQAGASRVRTLDDYQELVHAKTGAAFGLAFAGLALVNGRSDALCAVMLTAGELFGGLLQYVDDLVDQSLHTTATTAAALSDPFFWPRISSSYRQAIEQLLIDYEPALAPPMLALFDHTFARPPAGT